MAIANSSFGALSLQAFLHGELQKIDRVGEVKQVKSTEAIVYRSAIALQSYRQENAMDAATEIAEQLLDLPSNSSQQTIAIEVVPPGLLFFRFREARIARWLQALGDRVLPAAEPARHPFPWQPVETAQYAHARCCSLLRLAHREGTIAFAPEAFDPAIAASNVLAPDDLSLRTLQNWRTDRLRSQSQKLRSWETPRHSSERRLLVCAATAADILHGLESDRSGRSRNLQKDFQKASEELGRAFLHFHRDCRIFGDVARTQPDLAAARVASILAIQKLLWELLCLRLHAIAPREL